MTGCMLISRLKISQCVFQRHLHSLANYGRCATLTGFILDVKQNHAICRRTYVKPRQHDAKTFFKKDGMDPTKNELVYACGSKNYVLCGVIAFDVSLIPGLFFAISPFVDSTFLTNVAFHSGSQTLLEFVGYLSTLWIINLALFSVIRTYPLRIYYEESAQRFMIIHQSVVPTRIYKKECLHGEVKPSSFAVFKFLNIFRLRKGFVYLDETAFRLPADYNYMVGYYKERK